MLLICFFNLKNFFLRFLRSHHKCILFQGSKNFFLIEETKCKWPPKSNGTTVEFWERIVSNNFWHIKAIKKVLRYIYDTYMWTRYFPLYLCMQRILWVEKLGKLTLFLPGNIRLMREMALTITSPALKFERMEQQPCYSL